MTAIKHLLVPTDGSEHSLKAAAVAGELARALDAKISILMIQDERLVVAEAWNAVEGPPSAAGSAADARQAMESTALQRELADTKSAVGEGVSSIECHQLWGHPADEICGFAKQHGVDLIVMGSHGRSALKRAILGSVSHAVVNSAHCAVTIVR